MHLNGVAAKLSKELAEVEAKLNARLEAIEAKFDALLERLSRPPAPRRDTPTEVGP